MKIAVLGATGRAGSAIVAEARRRGHEVLAVVRDPQKAADRLGATVATLVKEPLVLTEADLDSVDAVVDALSVPWGSGRGYLHLDFATHLVSLLRNSDTLAVFILGSASLAMPGADHPMILDFPESAASQPWYDGALYQYYEYQFLQMNANVNWHFTKRSLSKWTSNELCCRQGYIAGGRRWTKPHYDRQHGLGNSGSVGTSNSNSRSNRCPRCGLAACAAIKKGNFATSRGDVRKVKVAFCHFCLVDY